MKPLWPALLLAALWTVPAWAEPYLAAREGLKCGACHVNTSGGGMRTEFGNLYAQTTLAARRIETGSQEWNQLFRRLLRLGGDLRSRGEYTRIPDQPATSSFTTGEMRLYGAAALIPERLLLYVDQQLAPGASINREAYLRLNAKDGLLQLKVGKMYLPFGLRLEDDTAFIRQVSGINFETPDTGLELGLEWAGVTTQLAVSNGAAGARDVDTGKQFSLRTALVRPNWRIGVSGNVNDTEGGTREMYALFATLRTGPIAWLGEYDRIDDATFTEGSRKMAVALLEGNLAVVKGHNLKLTAEFLDPDTELDEDERNRYSLVHEYTPFQFLQLRGGARVYDGIPQNDLQNRELYFIELHGFF